MTRTAKHLGFSRTKKIFVALVALLATIMLFVPITSTKAYAEDTGTKDLNASLLPNTDEFEQINVENGTTVVFVRVASDFDLTEIESSPIDEELLSTNPTTILTQKYYYDSNNSNYLCVSFKVMFGDGRAIYVEAIDGTCSGYTNDTSDFYKPYRCTCEFSLDQSSVFVTFYCDHYINNKVVSGDRRTLSVTFRADSGDVYE